VIVPVGVVEHADCANGREALRLRIRAIRVVAVHIEEEADTEVRGALHAGLSFIEIAAPFIVKNTRARRAVSLGQS
jgi:hypothetical protein